MKSACISRITFSKPAEIYYLSEIGGKYWVGFSAPCRLGLHYLLKPRDSKEVPNSIDNFTLGRRKLGGVVSSQTRRLSRPYARSYTDKLFPGTCARSVAWRRRTSRMDGISLLGAFRSLSTESTSPRRNIVFPCLSRTLPQGGNVSRLSLSRSHVP